jgi:hypothetical protein
MYTHITEVHVPRLIFSMLDGWTVSSPPFRWSLAQVQAEAARTFQSSEGSTEEASAIAVKPGS